MLNNLLFFTGNYCNTGYAMIDQTEENEDDDPEYKAPQDVAEEEEEYRTDMAVKVSCKLDL